MVENKDDTCYTDTDKNSRCFNVISIISVDERGQMVLPKEIRQKAGIQAGDKLALIGWEKDGKICCISLVRAEELGGMIKGVLGSMVKEIMA